MLIAGQYCGLNENIKNTWGERIFAGLVTCALHVGVVSLIWFNQPTHRVYVASAGEPMFVEMLSAATFPEPQMQVAYSDDPIDRGMQPLAGDSAATVSASDIQPRKKNGNLPSPSR